MKIKNILESSKQVKKTRNSEYERIRLAGENVRIHRAISASGKSKAQLRALKNLSPKEREKKEKSILQKVKSMSSDTEVDHTDSNKNNNGKNNLTKMKKSKHTAKTNSTRA